MLRAFLGLRPVSLKRTLIVPFVVQIVVAVGLVGYLSYRSGQQSVEDLANHLLDTTGENVKKYLDFYLQSPQKVNQINRKVLEAGVINEQDFQRLGQYFWQQLQSYDFSYINYGNQQNEFIGAGYFQGVQEIAEVRKPKLNTIRSYQVDKQGNRIHPPLILEEKNPNQADWYTKAVEAKRPIWSPIYNWSGVPTEISISASAPVYDRTNQLLGVVGIDLSLAKISTFLGTLELGHTGQVLIIERSGLLVANSGSQKPYKIIGNKAHRVHLKEIQDPVIRALIQNNGTLGRSQYQQTDFITQTLIPDRDNFIQVIPYQDAYGLNWLILLAIPKSDFMAEIQANNNRTILLCLLTLFTATAIGIQTANNIARPIQQLSKASQLFAEGKLQESVPTNVQIGELKSLSESFNRMVTEIQQTQTELQRTNSELVKANRSKDEFLAVMSHELRTPLAAILGMTEGLQEQTFGKVNEQQNTALQTIKQRGTHLLALINDILDIARIASGELQLNYALTNVSSLCHACLTSVKPQLLEKSIQLETKIPPGLPALRVDEQRIRQVLINLLDNATKFTPSGGRITLEVFPPSQQEALTEEGFLKISITDTGIGIAPEHLNQLFQPFVQVDSALNRKYEGTGLGLALVKRIVELHGGQITLTSQVGMGSCFMIALPCSNMPVIDVTNSWHQANIDFSQIDFSRTEHHPSSLILLAEDKEANVSTVSSYLKAKGYQILWAKNGQEAIDLAQSQQPSLMLMDTQISGVDILGLMKQMRSDPGLFQIPIIVLAASGIPDDRDRYLAAGATDYITKPIKLKQLVATIQQTLSQN